MFESGNYKNISGARIKTGSFEIKTWALSLAKNEFKEIRQLRSRISKKHNREIIKHLGELPEFTNEMSDEKKMKICIKVFDRLNDTVHPVRVNLEKMKKEAPEIRIIEGHEN
ncbi:MAG TPA: hypothetical protein VLH61_08140 [Bacteroidales bacterium]|nr:hypothetical protein [Bacteroidales bacterium]